MTHHHPALEIGGLNVFYGAVHALRGVSLKVNHGEIVSILGANGAGKSSLLAAISRVTPIKSGAIRHAGVDLLKLSSAEVVRGGLVQCPEGRRIFPEMSVLENLLLGACSVADKYLVGRNMQLNFKRFPILKARLSQPGGTLSGGEQQMLAIARALMSSPKVLLLDEPSLGLAPKIIQQIFSIITQINRDDGVTVLLVEQNANEALLHSHRAYVLETGRVTLEGPAKEMLRNPKVVEAYLG